jgi:geranylgeranyl reductase family protein
MPKWGSTASAVLAENGINTLLIEKEKLPRAKICGGAVSKRALSILESANIKIPKLKTFKKCNSMQLGTFDFDLVENLANIKFDKEAAYLTNRDEFDYAIVQDAIFKGAELKQNSRVKNIKKESAQYIIKGDEFSIKSKYLLCADGVLSTSAKLLGFRNKFEDDKVGLCIESNITDYEPPLAPLNFYYGGVKRGYAWIFDKGDHASIGTGAVLQDASNLRQKFNSFVRNYRSANSAENLKVNAWKIPGTGGISGSFAKGNSFLLGDAAGLVDPFLGEGISYAIQSGKLAAECIIDNRIDDYNEKIEEEITSSLKYARILLNIVKHNPKRFIKLLSNDKTIARNYVEIVLGSSTYKQFLKNTFKKILVNPLKLF